MERQDENIENPLEKMRAMNRIEIVEFKSSKKEVNYEWYYFKKKQLLLKKIF